MNPERPVEQRYLCPDEHGTWFVQRDPLTLEWLLGQDPHHTAFRVAASVPICALCGSALVEVATLEAWLNGGREGSLAHRLINARSRTLEEGD